MAHLSSPARSRVSFFSAFLKSAFSLKIAACADNGVGKRFCDFGKCKLKCPPGLAQAIHQYFPDIMFCA